MGLPNYGPSRSNDVALSLAAQRGGKRGPPSNMQARTHARQRKARPHQGRSVGATTLKGAHLHVGVMCRCGSAHAAAADANRKRQNAGGQQNKKTVTIDGFSMRDL